MFGRRRRPLARAAVVGGAAYAVGKRRSRVEADDAYEQGAEDAMAQPDEGISDDGFAQIEKLGELKERGLLTQQEFDSQKAKILNAH